jgi:hypothetical protein
LEWITTRSHDCLARMALEVAWEWQDLKRVALTSRLSSGTLLCPKHVNNV